MRSEGKLCPVYRHGLLFKEPPLPNYVRFIVMEGCSEAALCPVYRQGLMVPSRRAGWTRIHGSRPDRPGVEGREPRRNYVRFIGTRRPPADGDASRAGISGLRPGPDIPIAGAKYVPCDVDGGTPDGPGCRFHRHDPHHRADSRRNPVDRLKSGRASVAGMPREGPWLRSGSIHGRRMEVRTSLARRPLQGDPGPSVALITIRPRDR